MSPYQRRWILGALVMVAFVVRASIAHGEQDCNPGSITFCVKVANLTKSSAGATSRYTIVNGSESMPANVVHAYYTGDAIVSSVNDAIPAGGETTYNLASVPDGYTGYALVLADQPITVRMETPFYPPGAPTPTPILTPAIYLPAAIRP